MNIGFLLNHYELHQIPHVMPYAVALARLYPDIRVSILSSSVAQTRYAKEVAAACGEDRCEYETLKLPRLARWLDPLVSQWIFIRKRAALEHNVARFAQLDALVTPEMTALALRRHPRLAKMKLIFTGHGAGDNPHFGSLDARIGEFDLCLLPGDKYAEALLGAGLLRAGQAVVTGYPKFEALGQQASKRLSLFNNDRPTVVYNPHHRRASSSWRRMGTEVLDYFYASQRYNLIFAPHVVLFKRAWGRGSRLPSRYQSNQHVLIDPGSSRSVDMTYLRAADIYLGDISSQVYEFLIEPRPCVFLDVRDPERVLLEDILSWKFGPVIRNLNQLDAALSEAVEEHARYRPIQQNGFDYTFSINNTPAGERGAQAIVEFLSAALAQPS